MNQKIILSADSTCDLNQQLKERYDVHFFPFHIVLGEKDYLDNVNITANEIFKAYREKKILPKTAAFSVGECYDYFKQWTDQGYEVIHLNLGGALSATYQNCRIAADMLGGVYPVDSRNLSTGTGHLVIEAAEMIEKGMRAEDIAKELEAMTTRVHASFILDTLEYMAAGGRCSMVAAMGANLLRLKPCIEVENQSGAMHVGKKYRGNLSDVLVQYTKDKLSAYTNIKTKRIFITYSTIEEKYVDLVQKAIEETIPFDEIYRTNASCTISCHCGPNTLGILFMTNT